MRIVLAGQVRSRTDNKSDRAYFPPSTRHESMLQFPSSTRRQVIEVYKAVQTALAARSVVDARGYAAGAQRALSTLIEENALLQMTHVRTHPSVAGRLAEGSLTVHGWVYDIGNGDVRIHDAESERFVPIDDFKITAPGQDMRQFPSKRRQ